VTMPLWTTTKPT